MSDLFILLGHLLTTVAKLLRPGGARHLSRAIRTAHGGVISNSPCTGLLIKASEIMPEGELRRPAKC
jgi:hypothetical protein